MKNGLLSFAEARLWQAVHRESGSTAFVECPVHIVSALSLNGTFRADVLGDSLNEVIRRHAVLRSTFTSPGGRPERVVTPAVRREFPVTDLTGLDDEERRAAVERSLADSGRRSFDLSRGPLVRCCILRKGKAEHILALTIHHMVFDGWSLQIMWRELGLLYGAYSRGHPSPLPELEADYADYVNCQRRRLEGGRLRKLTAYWARRLRGLAELRIPADRARGAHVSNHSGTERVRIAADPTQGVRRLSRDLGVTLGIAMATIFKVLLHKVTGAVDIAIGMPVSDRNRPEFEQLVGLFLNLLVVRTELSSDPTFVDVVERVRRGFMEDYRHRDLPFSFLEGSDASGAHIETVPLRAVFNFLSMRQAAPSFAELVADRIEVEGARPSFADLSLHLIDRGASLEGFVLYKADLFSRARIRTVVGLFERILSESLAFPQRRISELTPLVPASARRRR